MYVSFDFAWIKKLGSQPVSLKDETGRLRGPALVQDA